MVRRIGGNSPITGVETPELTDFATNNYKNVIQKTLDNYSQAASAAASKAQVDQQNAGELRRRAIQAEEERLAQNRANNANRGDNGAGILGAISQLGQVVAQGLSAREAIAQQRKENELALKREQRAQESHEMNKESHQMGIEAQAQKAQLAQLDGMVQSVTQEWELQLQDTIINGSREAGYTQATAYVNEFRNSEYFTALPPHQQFYINSNMNKWLTQQRGESLSQIEGERKALINSQRDVAAQQVQVRYAPILQEINTGASVLTPDDINERIGRVNDIILDTVENDPSLQGIIKNKTAYLEYISEAYKPLNAAITNYYETTGQRSSEGQRFVQAVQGIAALENLRSTPGVGMTDSEYQAQGSLLLRQLGLPGSLESFPTTQTNIARQRNEDYEQIRRLEETVHQSENLSRLREDNPQIEQARNYLVAKKVYNGLRDGSADGDIADLEYAIKQSPSEAQARGWDRVLSYYKEFDSDRKTALDLQDELAKREQAYAALKSRITPPNQIEIRVPGDSGLGVDEQGTPLGTSPQSRVDIVDVERRVPQATQEELDALEQQLEVTRSRIGELGNKWQRRGLNIFNPSDEKPLNEFRQRVEATMTVVDQESTSSQIPESSNPTPPSAPRDNSTTNKLGKALDFELERGQYYELPRISGLKDDRTTLDALIELNQGYLQGITEIKKAHTDGKYVDLEKIIKGLPKAGLGTNVKLYQQHFNTLKAKLENADDLLVNKARWYKHEWGEPSEGVVVTPNFTDGGQRTKPQTVATPRNRQPDAPTMPLAGNLANMPSSKGYAPFRGGNVRMHSPFGMRVHPVHGTRRMHKGIDISSDDPRVATIQGGEVVHVGAKNQHNGGYGNYVIVKTKDGKYELFAHLRSVSVTKGQILDPASQIGLMGGGANDPGRGTSTGRHLHFEVGTKFSGGYISGQVDPMGYIGSFTGNVELPRGQGDLGHGNTDYYRTPSGVSNTGVRKISENVYYSNGYILDRNTGKFRQATPNESAGFKSYTPMTTTSYRSQNVPSVEYNNKDGSTTVEGWEIPDEAINDGSYLFVHPTGRTNRAGQPVLAIRGYKDGRQLFAVEAVSGATGIGGDRTTSGRQGMLPEGKWTVARDTIPGSGAGVGDKFLSLTPTFGGHNRSAIGIHWDASKSGVTPGSLATFNIQDRDKIYNFVRNSGRSLNLYVNTSKVNKSLGKSTINSSHTGNPSTAHNQASSNRVAYSGKNNPTANYGYPGLAKNLEAARALAEAGDILGLPAVWIADYLYWESGFSANAVNTNIAATGEGNATGAFQVMPSTLKWLHPGMTMEQYKQKGLHWQLTVSLPKYIRQVEKDANGKKVRSIYDFAAAIWRGAVGLKHSEAERTRINWTDGYITWNEYKKKWGSVVGRSYANPQGGSNSNVIHRNPRQGCAQCQQMLHNGDFRTHQVGL